MTQLVIAGGKGLGMFEGATISNEYEPNEIKTPYGLPSGKISLVDWEGASFYCFSRHGDQQQLAPADIPYLANAYALKSLGVKYWVSVSLVSKLKGDFGSGCLVVADDYTSLGMNRKDNFLNGQDAPGFVLYIDNYASSVSSELKQALKNASLHSGIALDVNTESDPRIIPTSQMTVYAGMNGPETGTLAEEKILTSTFERVITGMTNMTEALVCKQAGIEFAGLSVISGNGLNYGGDIGKSISDYLSLIDSDLVPLLKSLVQVSLPVMPERDPVDFFNRVTGVPKILNKIKESGTMIEEHDSEVAKIIKVLLK